MSSIIQPRRRELIVGAAALAMAPRAAFAAPGKYMFAVFRNGTKVGEHAMTITQSGEDITASANVAMTIKVGPVPVYRYKHTATERWVNGKFASIETFTDANGKKQKVVAKAGGPAVTIEGPAGLVRAPANANPLSHWNTAAFGQPLFNQQEGKVLKVTATKVSPTHYRVRGEAEIDDFYDAAGNWVGLKGKLEDKSTLEYRRI